jgi:hypothetical protein
MTHVLLHFSKDDYIQFWHFVAKKGVSLPSAGQGLCCFHILGLIYSYSHKLCTKHSFSQIQQRALVNDWFNSVVVTQHTSYHK